MTVLCSENNLLIKLLKKDLLSIMEKYRFAILIGENLWGERFYDLLAYEDIMNVSDAVQGIFEYD